MANTDSFIDEVTEEVRRDKLFQAFRRWGWVGGLVVVLAVGGAAYFEYQRAQTRAQAQAFGDAILAALDQADPAARIAALEVLATDSPETEILLALFAANEAITAGTPGPAAARLRAAAEGADIPPRYRDLALLKAELMDPSEPAQARLILDQLARAGAPYAGLAQEQLALLDVREGNIEAGIEGLRAIERSAAATPGLQQRASQLIVALESGATLIDTRPVPEPEAEPAPVELSLPPLDDAGTETEAATGSEETDAATGTPAAND